MYILLCDHLEVYFQNVWHLKVMGCFTVIVDPFEVSLSIDILLCKLYSSE